MTALHAAHCDIWDLAAPDPGPEVALPDGRDEATVRYLAEVRPVYDTLGRVLAQLSGLFLLRLTGAGSGLHLDHDMFRVARDQLAGCEERLRALRLPPAATRHHGAMEDMAGHLAAAARAMESLATRRHEDDEAGRRAVLAYLDAAQRLLIATAEPGAQMTPVDFSHACCSCGAAGRR